MDNESRPQVRHAHKRADGEGSISAYKGGWRGRLMVGYKPDSKPDVREVYGATQAECRRKLGELRQRHEQSTLGERERERDTLGSYIERWLAAHQASVRPSTHKRYGQLLRLHIVPTLGRKRLTALKADEVQATYAGLRGRIAPRTVRHVHTVLHTALSDAVKWGYVARNVCDLVDPPRVQAMEMHPPVPADLAGLLDAAKEDRWLSLWTLAVYTGARQGELLGLQWQDVDLVAGTITIQRTLLQTTRAGVPDYAPPKTARSRRTVTLPGEAVASLAAHRLRQLEQRLALGAEYTDYGLVFATATGTPLGYRNVVRAFKVALGRADLPATIRFHDLRHAAATTMLQVGVPLKVASERLGHSNIGITADLYTHAVASMEADAAARLETAIRGKAAS